jgi:hypothetical protein
VQRWRPSPRRCRLDGAAASAVSVALTLEAGRWLL